MSHDGIPRHVLPSRLKMGKVLGAWVEAAIMSNELDSVQYRKVSIDSAVVVRVDINVVPRLDAHREHPRSHSML
jgi:hypothetical protein